MELEEAGGGVGMSREKEKERRSRKESGGEGEGVGRKGARGDSNFESQLNNSVAQQDVVPKIFFSIFSFCRNFLLFSNFENLKQSQTFIES